MPYAHSDALRIDYDAQGRGEPALLLLPGWCADRTVFHDLAALTGAHRRTLSLDWRGHGGSDVPPGDFGADSLIADAMAVLEAGGVRRVVPVALSHAGWVAIELRRRMPERIPALVLLDWIVLEAPRPFLDALEGMQSPARWQQTVDQIFSLWLNGVEEPRVHRFIREGMGSYGFDMWSRAAREIGRAYAAAGSPLRALSALDPPPPVLHLYAQPDAAEYLAAQQWFAAANPWFRVLKLDARSHFPMLEAPAAMAEAIERFLAEVQVAPSQKSAAAPAPPAG